MYNIDTVTLLLKHDHITKPNDVNSRNEREY
jgi:hypothetical protein